MNEILEYIKELLLIKKEDSGTVGLTSLKNKQKNIVKKAINKKKAPKDMKLSELMRRRKTSIK